MISAGKRRCRSMEWAIDIIFEADLCPMLERRGGENVVHWKGRETLEHNIHPTPSSTQYKPFLSLPFPISSLFIYSYPSKRHPCNKSSISIHHIHPIFFPPPPPPQSHPIPSHLHLLYFPCLCLCFGFNEQIIYTCPLPFFPPFLLTLYITTNQPLSPFPPFQSKIKHQTYLTPLTHLLHRTPDLHPADLLPIPHRFQHIPISNRSWGL